MLYIRKYEETDFDNAEYVCLHCDDEEDDAETQEFVLHFFCDYYLEQEPQNCFVVDDGGRAVGYVICAADFDAFKPVFFERYLPLVDGLGEKRLEWAMGSIALYEEFKSEYPAHLHVDLLPPYHRQGWGSRLLGTLFDHLRAAGCTGVMLTTGVDNVSAVAFYKKLGLQRIATRGTEVAYGLKLV